MPAPGEDGEPQTLDEARFWPAIYAMAVVLAAVWIYWAVKGLMTYLALRGAQ